MSAIRRDRTISESSVPKYVKRTVSALFRLASKVGIERTYVNARGEAVQVHTRTIAAVLSAMNLAAENESAARDRLAELEDTERRRMLPPVVVVRTDSPAIHIRLNPKMADRKSVRWRLGLDDGTSREGASKSSRLGFTIEEKIPPGYHRLEAGEESVPLIAAPSRCWTPDAFESRRLWGVAAQLYLLRSESNWGIGDFGDLKRLAEIAAGFGASVIGLNPLHAMFLDDPEHASPYSPASRLFLNPLNIEVPAIPEFAASRSDRNFLSFDNLTRTAERLCARDLLDFNRAARLKLKALRMVFDDFCKRGELARRVAFAQFRASKGDALERFAIFQAIRLKRALAGNSVEWRRWPAPMRKPASPQIKEFAESERAQVDFIAWMQWIADTQLEEAAKRAASASMQIGLYRDLAVGSDANGAESWANQRVVADGAHAGVPPDIFNPAGQDWGLAPFNPRALREEGYASFIDLVRANMRHAGALRIDHVLGMLRLYWVPRGHPASEGTYVTYPFDDLAAILALESERNRCLVVGEDLGTVPRGFRNRLARAGILSYKVLYFEQTKSGGFIPPAKYPPLSLATIGNHDMATAVGWWQGLDIKLHEEKGLYPQKGEARRQYRQRDQDKENLLKALRKEGLEVGDGTDIEPVVRAMHAFLARTKSSIAMVQMDNLTREQDQVNLPGSTDQYPNWRRRYSITIEQLVHEPKVEELISIFRSIRK